VATDLGDLMQTRPHHRPLWARVLLVTAALLFFALGVVGWLVPVVTGIPFYVIGFVLLALGSERGRQWVNALDRRLPHSTRVALRHGLRRIPIRWLREHIHLSGDEPPPSSGPPTR
jgi:hypothetical protein